jgi:hypothetical protein
MPSNAHGACKTYNRSGECMHYGKNIKYAMMQQTCERHDADEPSARQSQKAQERRLGSHCVPHPRPAVFRLGTLGNVRTNPVCVLAPGRPAALVSARGLLRRLGSLGRSGCWAADPAVGATGTGGPRLGPSRGGPGRCGAVTLCWRETNTFMQCRSLRSTVR